MKKTKEQSIRKKTIRAIVIMVVTLIPVSVFMTLGGMRFTRDRENVQVKLKMDALASLVANENEMYNAALSAFDGNLAAHMSMMTASLRKLVAQGEFTGPHTLSDGFVVELRNDRVILPEDMPKGQLRLSQSFIEQSLALGRLRTGRFAVEDAAADSAFPLDDAGQTGIQYQPGIYLLSFAKISDDLIYVSMVLQSMLDETINSYVEKNYTAVVTIQSRTPSDPLRGPPPSKREAFGE